MMKRLDFIRILMNDIRFDMIDFIDFLMFIDFYFIQDENDEMVDNYEELIFKNNELVKGINSALRVIIISSFR